MAKLKFQKPLFQSSVSHGASEIILIWWFAMYILIYSQKKMYDWDDEIMRRHDILPKY